MAHTWIDGEVIDAQKLNAYAEDIVEGVSPTVSISKSGTTTTITITDINGTHTATIEDGTNGTDGVSPTVSVSKVGKVTTITITDKDGVHTATINDGNDGQGTGDMLKSTYDSTSAVENAGGIASYVSGLGLEDTDNKVTSISASSTDTQYPSAKLLFDQLALKENLGKVTIGGTEYEVRTGTSGASGYITIEVE